MTFSCKHQQQIQAMEKFGGTSKLADAIKESSIFDYEDVTLEKHSIDKTIRLKIN